MNKFIPGGQMDPSNYNQLLDPVEARYRLARAVLAEIPRQVASASWSELLSSTDT
jgi:hypothetical protein